MTIGQKEGKHFRHYDIRTNDNWPNDNWQNDNWPKRSQIFMALRLSDERQWAK